MIRRGLNAGELAPVAFVAAGSGRAAFMRVFKEKMDK
jgi:hypothetical protein